MLPNQLQFSLHAGALAGDRDDRVLLGHDNSVLPKRAIAAEGVVPAAPKLVAIALVPIALTFQPFQIRSAWLLNLECRRLFDPVSRQYLASIPQALLQVKLAKLGKALRLNDQSPATSVNPPGTR